MEASALRAPVALAGHRLALGPPLLRLRSDEQLVELFRAGHDEAFRVIHDRYRQRLFAYTRQMLPGSRQDAEDALQDVLVRAYAGLRANDRELALRAWLYRVAHNRCVDELRRPAPPPPEVLELVRGPVHDPTAHAEQRESFRRLLADIQRLPAQQRSALLMRELVGMSYTDVAAVLEVSVPAVKSLLVRARVGLAQALEARDTACTEIRDELMQAHDRGVRPNAMARRHMRDCAGCREFRAQIRSVSRQFAALAPAVGPLGLLAKLLGGGVGGGGGGAASVGGAAGTGGAAASVGAIGVGHVATLLAATVVTAGSALEVQHTIVAPPRATHHHHVAKADESRSGRAVLGEAATGATQVNYSSYSTAAPSQGPIATNVRSTDRPRARAASSAPAQPQNASITPLGTDPGSATSTTLPASGTDVVPPATDGSSAASTVTAPADGNASSPSSSPSDSGASSTSTGSSSSSQPGSPDASGPVPIATGSGSDGSSAQSGSSGSGSTTATP